MTLVRLRNWILVLAAGLLVVIAGFFLRARWVGRRLSRDVPYELAKAIQQSTQGFTHSESRGGHTIYTLHASKAVQFKSDGHAELHDVSITLYNAEGAPANRIYGKAFDWDPVHGIARALGEVQIDLEGGEVPGGKAGNDRADQDSAKSTVHLKTSGLVFNKQTGLATTTEPIEFRLSAAAGSAVGASFNSQTGEAILMSDVAFNSSVGGSPFSVRARHAQFERTTQLLYLLQDVIDFQDNRSSSDQATLSFRPDGSASRAEVEGNVVLTGGKGEKINTRKAVVDLDAKSAPVKVTTDGGLLYVAASEGRQMHGSASQGTMVLGPELTLRHAQLRDAVSLVEVETFPVSPNPGSQRSNRPQSSSRAMQASRIDVDFGPSQDRTPQASRIVAVGGARMNVHTIYSNTPPQDTTIQGDELVATLTSDEALSSLQGTGHTSLVELTPGGAKQSSTGDTLLINFAAPQKRAENANPSSPQVTQVSSANQQGHVSLTQQAAPKQQAPATQTKVKGTTSAEVVTAFANRADYDAASQVVQLSGSPRVRNDDGEVAAGHIRMERITGNAEASDGVKATYQRSAGQPNVSFSGAGPVHVVADHAHLDHATDVTTFYGKNGAPARMWQGSDSIAAPVLELSSEQATLVAQGVGSEAGAVTAIFTSASNRAGTPGGTPGKAGASSVIRVQSRTLHYADKAHKATFGGGVVTQAASGTVRSGSMDIYLLAAPPAGSQPGQQSSSVERIVARSAVEIEQPGRKGTGEELTYTAADNQFVLTGTSAAPPRLTDQVRGTVTGVSLIFNDRDDSVIVSGGTSKAVTQTRVSR